MDEFDDGRFEMEYGGMKSPAPDEVSSYPLLELTEDTPVPEVLAVSNSHRCGALSFDTDTSESSQRTSYRSSYDKIPAVALSADTNRIALHPLGNTSTPTGVDRKRWNSLDTERLQTETRYFTLRQEPLFDISETTREQYPVPVPPVPVEPPEPESDEERKHDPSEMPFLDHLEEFRWALLKSLATLAIGLIAGWFLSDLFYKTITRLSTQSELPLIYTELLEPIMVKLQMALVIGLVVSLPFVFYFIWSFIAPGLYKHEKRWIMPLVWGATGCFFAGASLAYFIIIPFMLQFIKAFMPEDIEPMITIGNFISTLLKFTILFGVIFEMPMVTFVLAKIGIIKHTWMKKYRKYAIVSIFILGAIFTPPEPISQIMMATPLILLYEVSILVARFAGRKTVI